MTDEYDDFGDEAEIDVGADAGVGVTGGAFNAVVGEHGGRLDKILAGLCPDLSRTRLKALIQQGQVTVDGRACDDPSAGVTPGQALGVAIPAPVSHYPTPEAIPLDIVFEDESMLVINKQAGLVVHPGAGNHSGTLVNALLHHCGDSLSGIGGVLRPGIVHRLDKETSGLMVVAKSDIAHRGLSAQLADRTLSREYQAVVWKIPAPPMGRVDIALARAGSNRQKMAVVRQGGRNAVTHYKVAERYGQAAALVICKLETGRTHQIRVHMDHIGHSVVGDPLYGMQPTAERALLKKGNVPAEVIERILAFPRQALHAWRIGFIHPLTGEAMRFEAAPPEDMMGVISLFKSMG